MPLILEVTRAAAAQRGGGGLSECFSVVRGGRFICHLVSRAPGLLWNLPRPLKPLKQLVSAFPITETHTWPRSVLNNKGRVRRIGTLDTSLTCHRSNLCQPSVPLNRNSNKETAIHVDSSRRHTLTWHVVVIRQCVTVGGAATSQPTRATSGLSAETFWRTKMTHEQERKKKLFTPSQIEMETRVFVIFFSAILHPDDVLVDFCKMRKQLFLLSCWPLHRDFQPCSEKRKNIILFYFITWEGLGIMMNYGRKK